MRHCAVFATSRLSRRGLLTRAGAVVATLRLGRPAGRVLASPRTIERAAAIHTGACAALNPTPAYLLDDIVFNPGSHAASVVSVTTIPAALRDLLAKPFAIRVHEPSTGVGGYEACGEITGIPNGNEVIVGLRMPGIGGYAGIASLRAAGDQTIVTLDLIVDFPPADAPPVPRATSAPVVLAETTIASVQIIFKVGQPYDFVVTNRGCNARSFLIEERGDMREPLAQEGRTAETAAIAPGRATKLLWTFAAPGAFTLVGHRPGNLEADVTVDINAVIA